MSNVGDSFSLSYLNEDYGLVRGGGGILRTSVFGRTPCSFGWETLVALWLRQCGSKVNGW